MAGDWLAGRRAEIAAERILDAAGELFAQREPATVGMREIAATVGCSRATLYRYFDNRDALHSAYVHREANRLYHELTERLAGTTDAHQRLIDGVIAAVHSVRDSPALSSWFSPTQRPIGGEIADRSEVITTFAKAFVTSLDSDADIESRARWLIRVITSLLLFPGRDEADERTMLRDFVAPVVASTSDEPAMRPGSPFPSHRRTPQHDPDRSHRPSES